MYYDYLILRKADVYIPHIKRCDVSEDLKSLKIKCIQETQKIIDQLYDNLFWNIHIKELEQYLMQRKKFVYIMKNHYPGELQSLCVNL